MASDMVFVLLSESLILTRNRWKQKADGRTKRSKVREVFVSWCCLTRRYTSVTWLILADFCSSIWNSWHFFVCILQRAPPTSRLLIRGFMDAKQQTGSFNRWSTVLTDKTKLQCAAWVGNHSRMSRRSRWWRIRQLHLSSKTSGFTFFSVKICSCSISIVFYINRLVDCSVKCQKMVENVVFKC